MMGTKYGTIRQMLTEMDSSFGSIFNATADTTSLIELSTKPIRYLIPTPGLGSFFIDKLAGLNQGIGPPGVTEDAEVDAYIARKALLYEFGLIPVELRRFIWHKKSTVVDLNHAIEQSLDSDSFLPGLILVRAVLEHVGTAEQLNNELAESLSARSARRGLTNNGLSEFGLDKRMAANVATLCSSRKAISVRSEGTRVDWDNFLTHSLKSGKRKSYKSPHEKAWDVDVDARDLMKSIDVLNKQVKGARNAYEFLCEFAHPNVGTSIWNCAGGKSLTSVSGFVLFELKHARRDFRMGMLGLVARLNDLFAIHSACTKRLSKIDALLVRQHKLLQDRARAVIGSKIKSEPGLFFSDDYCPCLSGHRITKCCGKNVKKSKFVSMDVIQQRLH